MGKKWTVKETGVDRERNEEKRERNGGSVGRGRMTIA
jgi:hypothetical protein